ncbi:unnamed protein product [[Candida] boidinii]|uniref:Unnamed protein product n=1 Tax=Candida boidinii TaxID=5477 RepID=A0A9W6STR5_CANBO|nr:unnamed protein product [[Candida] boidinii]
MSQLDPHGELLYIVSQNSPVFNTNTEILSSPTLSPRIFQTMSQNNTINNNTKNLPDKMESLSLSRFEADSVNTVTSVSNMNNNDNKLPTKYINENSSTATLQNMTQQIIPGASTNKQIITENTSNNNIGNMSNNDDDDIQISPALLASSVGKDIGGVLVPSLSTISLLSLNHTPISEPQATTSTSNTPIFASNSNPWQQRQNSITQQRHQHYQLHHQNSYQNSQSQSQSQSQSTQQQVPRLSPISKTSQPEQDITSPRPALAPTLSNLMNLGSASTSTVTTLSNVTTNHSNKNEEQEVTPNPLTKSLPVPNSITKGSLTFSTNIPQPAAFASNISSSISPSSGITQTPSISPRIPFTTIHSLSPKPILMLEVTVW